MQGSDGNRSLDSALLPSKLVPPGHEGLLPVHLGPGYGRPHTGRALDHKARGFSGPIPIGADAVANLQVSHKPVREADRELTKSRKSLGHNLYASGFKTFHP